MLLHICQTKSFVICNSVPTQPPGRPRLAALGTCVLQTKGLGQPCIRQVSGRHFANRLKRLSAFLSNIVFLIKVRILF